MRFRYVEADTTAVLRNAASRTSSEIIFKARQAGLGVMIARGASPHQAIIVARERG